MHVKNKLIIHIIYINISVTLSIVMKNKAYTEHANPLPHHHSKYMPKEVS